MGNAPKVTIFLWSYNHAKYLRDTIESLLHQTFTDFELFIEDDASSDQSWAIIQSYKDPRIVSHRNFTNRNDSEWFKKVVSELSSGIYIAIHHSDDIWYLDKLEKQVSFLDNHPEIGAAFTNITIIDEDSHPFEDENHFYYKIFDQPNRSRFEWLNYFFYNGNALCHPSVLIRKECFKECGFYRTGLAQLGDFDMWVRLCFKYEIYVLPEKLVRFRVRANEMNFSGNRLETRIRDQFENLQVINLYRQINSFDDLLKIFPETTKFDLSGKHDLGYALAMISLEGKTQRVNKLFGLQLLFEALNSPNRAREIESLYNFTQRDFLILTARHDPFSIELQLKYNSQDNDPTIITSSPTWKMAVFLENIKNKLFPPFSLRLRMAKWIAQRLFFFL